jgi:hypothetical protein
MDTDAEKALTRIPGSGSDYSFGGASVLASRARQEPRPTKLTHYRIPRIPANSELMGDNSRDSRHPFPILVHPCPSVV